MEKLIITAAICGAEVTKKHNPAVPYTVEEMVREAKSAFEAGAAVIHVHVREDDGTPTQDRERFRVVLDAIKEACPGVILIPSTGGAVGMTAEERLQPTELFPEMATLDCGTCNFGDDVFTNDMPTMRAFGKRMMENHIKPEYECFEIGHLDTVVNMANKGEVPGAPMQFNFVLGVSGCTPATVGNLDYLVKQIPAGSTWTVTGVGPTGNVVALVICQEDADLLKSMNLCHHAIVGSATNPTEVLEKSLAVNGGKEYDVSILIVNVPACEMAAILPVRDNGTVYFFSMATDFAKAALGAEGCGKDVTMIVGNGYTKDHAEITLSELRENAQLKEYFE